MRTHVRFLVAVLAACSSAPSSSSTTPATTTGEPKAATATPASTAPAGSDNRLDKLMRTRMNKAYTQLTFYVLDSATDVDFAKIEVEAKELQAAVVAVRSLPTPKMVESAEAREVYTTYNDVLQRDADKFYTAVATKDRPVMEQVLTKIGKTCNDCHRFFRVDVKDAKK